LLLVLSQDVVVKTSTSGAFLLVVLCVLDLRRRTNHEGLLRRLCAEEAVRVAVRPR
jgi:hypothetical protein